MQGKFTTVNRLLLLIVSWCYYRTAKQVACNSACKCKVAYV